MAFEGENQVTLDSSFAFVISDDRANLRSVSLFSILTLAVHSPAFGADFLRFEVRRLRLAKSACRSTCRVPPLWVDESLHASEREGERDRHIERVRERERGRESY